jgi:hypothetical protein
MNSILNTDTKRDGSATMELQHTPACGEDRIFKCMKTFQMWERLHKKKCDLCRSGSHLYFGVERSVNASTASEQQRQKMIRNQEDERMKKMSRIIA